MSAPQTTSQFLNTLGVNVHVEYTDGKYANASNVIADLAYLGENHVRDAVLNPSNQGQSNYDALAAAGIKFDLFMQGNDLSSTLSLVGALVQRHPGAVSMIEGPNEVNNFPINYAGQSGSAAATAYQASLYAAVRADPQLNGVPVADLTSYPFLGGPSDDANFHFYPLSGAQPSSTLGATLTELATQEVGKPTVMTEGGYNTLLTDGYFGGVDEITQAKLLLNLYCDDAKQGVTNTYVYQLLDAYADPSGTNSDDHFGLFNLDNSPKAAATAIHNLTSVLSSGADVSAPASALAFSLSGLPSQGSALALTKNGATHDLLIWNEPAIWNGTAHSEIAAAAASVSLHLASAANVVVYDPLVSAQPIATYASIQDVVLSVVDHPLIVEVTDLPPPAQTAASTAAAASTSAASTPASAPQAVAATGSTAPTSSIASGTSTPTGTGASNAAGAAAVSPPVLSGAAASTQSDHAAGLPFSNMAISDPGASSETVTVSFAPSAGALSGGGFSQIGPGVYQVIDDSAATAQAALRALGFTPTVEPSGLAATTTTFTVSTSSGHGAASDASTAVTVTHTTNTPVALAGLSASSTPDTQATRPFAVATVIDPDIGQTETVTVTLGSSAAGSLSGGGFVAVSGSPGVYQVANVSAAAAQASLRAAVFNPVPNLSPAGSTSLEVVTVQVDDGASTARAVANINILSVDDAPVLGSVQASATFAGGAAAPLQPSLTISDSDVSASITAARVAITGYVPGDVLSVSPPSGVTASFDPASGVLSLSGVASDATYAQALRSLSFTHPGQVDAGVRTMTLTVTDDGGAMASASESLAVSAYAPAVVSTNQGSVNVPAPNASPATPTTSFSLANAMVQADNLLRITSSDAVSADPHGAIGASLAMAASVAAQVALGQLSQTAAETALLHLADATTSVAELTYAFFTGSTPSAPGLNYLVHSDVNASDLNDAYYAQFSTQNRYINLAVSLAQGGAGTAAFHAAYDSLSLTDATAKAYAAVFGMAASADKVSAILNASVSDGLGGTETRAQYFAAYGGDGVNGTGTKAAMIGWMLGEGVSEGVGPYANAEANFVQDLAHGTAQFGVNLLSNYGSSPALVGQAVVDPTLMQ